MRRVMWAVALLAAAACVDKNDEREIDPAYVEANLVGELPDDLDNRVGADLGGKVIYAGNQVDAEAVPKGSEFRIVHYWRVVESPGSSWRVFAHAVGASDDDWLNVDATDMRIGYPPSEWRAGDIIRDEQVILVPEGWGSDHLDVRVGLYRKGGQSAGDRMSIASGPADDESRVEAARIEIGEPSDDDAPYAIRRAGGPVEIDGIAEEPAWERAPKSSAFVLAESGREMPGDARARLLWDDEHLYAFIEIEDPSIYSEFDQDGDPLWKQDVAELFIDADRSGQGYVELQVNPRGARFDAFFPTVRGQGGDTDWESGMRAAVDVSGDPTERDSDDDGWSAEIAIPLAAVKGTSDDMSVRIPPRIGDRWNLNVVRVDEPEKGEVTAASWNRIAISDFHALGRMLTVAFADEEGSTEVAEVASEAEPAQEQAAADDSEAAP